MKKGDFTMTKNTIESLQGKIGKSRTIRGEITRFSRLELENYRAEVSKINTDRTLSDAGKAIQIGYLKEDTEEKVLKMAQTFRKMENDALNAAREGANKILVGSLPKVDAQKQKLFQQKADQLEARAIFATSSG